MSQDFGFRGRAAVIGLVAVLLAPLFAVVSPRAVSAQACGAGSIPAYLQSWVSDGADEAAERLSDDANYDLGDPGSGYVWRVEVCVWVTGDVAVVGSPLRELSSAGQVADGQAKLAVMAELAAVSWVPRPAMMPEVGGVQYAGLESWLWLDRSGVDPWVPIGPVTETVDGVSVTGSAEPVATVWSFSDGGPQVRCEGPGVEWTEAVFAAGSVDRCVKDWVHSSAVRDISMAVAIEYEFSFPSTVSGVSSETRLGGWYGPVPLTVGEVLTEGVVGERDPLVDPGVPEPPVLDEQDCTLLAYAGGECSSLPDGEQGAAECSTSAAQFGDVGGGIFGWVTKPWEVLYKAGEAALGVGEWDAVGKEITDSWEEGKSLVLAGGELLIDAWGCVQWAVGKLDELLPDSLKFLIDVGYGCGKALVGQLTEVWDTVMTVKDAVTDTRAFIDDQVAMVMGLKQFIEQEGFDAFLIEMGEGFLELDTLREDGGAAWAGTAGCTIIVEVLKAFFSGGGSLGAKFGVRFKSLLDKLPMDARTRDRLDAMLGEDRDGDGKTDDRDDDSACSVYGGSCGCNSFPAGTLVLLASGAYRPIEMIDPGERVVTYDTASGVWRDQVVLAQWSGIHDGAMATIHLDGGSLTSTDGHEFWVNNRGEWIEADSLVPGDLLLGPNGVTRVESVTLTDRAGSVVWELDTATNNNFVIGDLVAGRFALTHNGDGCLPIDKTSRQTRDLTRAELNHAFDRHAKEIFGLEVGRSTHMERFMEIADSARRSNLTFANRRGGHPTLAHLARVNIDGEMRYVVIDFLDGPPGTVATITRPSPDQLERYLQLARRDGP